MWLSHKEVNYNNTLSIFFYNSQNPLKNERSYNAIKRGYRASK